jgi:hypothetical protein
MIGADKPNPKTVAAELQRLCDEAGIEAVILPITDSANGANNQENEVPITEALFWCAVTAALALETEEAAVPRHSEFQASLCRASGPMTMAFGRTAG